jgi:hypothetical protein
MIQLASYCNKIQHIDLSFCVDVTLDVSLPRHASFWFHRFYFSI